MLMKGLVHERSHVEATFPRTAQESVWDRTRRLTRKTKLKTYSKYRIQFCEVMPILERCLAGVL